MKPSSPQPRIAPALDSEGPPSDPRRTCPASGPNRSPTPSLRDTWDVMAVTGLVAAGARCGEPIVSEGLIARTEELRRGLHLVQREADHVLSPLRHRRGPFARRSDDMAQGSAKCVWMAGCERAKRGCPELRGTWVVAL
jgi:hypothetical protein